MQESRNIIITAIVALAIPLIGAGCVPAQGNATPERTPAVPVSQQPAAPPAAPLGETATEPVAGPATIIIKDFAFQPAEITVKKGTVVTWNNQDSAPHFVASDPHPTHTDLPGLSSGTLPAGGSFNFTFDSVGSFGYHCHLHPGMKGRIIVTE